LPPLQKAFFLQAVWDQSSRFSPAPLGHASIDNSLSGAHVARELDRAIVILGTSCTVVSDNATELTSRAMLAWQEERGVEWHSIAPGKLTDLERLHRELQWPAARRAPH